MWWWNSGAGHMNQPFPKAFFDRLRWAATSDASRSLQSLVNRRMRNRTSSGVGGAGRFRPLPDWRYRDTPDQLASWQVVGLAEVNKAWVAHSG